MSSPTPIDFSKYAQPGAAQIDFSKYESGAATTSAPPSVAARVRDNFASGLGVMSDEDAKNFFLHPVSTAIKSLDAQGALAVKAKDAYEKGDYKGALMYGLNYLVPFIGQQTAKAGEQMSEGDIAGGLARTAGAALPMVVGSPEARAVASDAASTVKSAVSSAASAAQPVLAKVAKVASDTIDPDLTGVLSPRLAHVQKALGKLSDALEKSQQAHAEAADLDATEANKPYAGETARGRTLGGVKPVPQVQAQPAAQPAPVPAAPAPQPPASIPLSALNGPRIVPSVQNIRENLAQAQSAEAAPSRITPDAMEDHALQQEMNQDLQRHGWAADSEARREFIARNSTGVTKGELTGAVEKPVKYTKTPGVSSTGSGVAGDSEDLLDLLRRSVESAKKQAKGQR
jgi:hypothetical protein